MTLPKRLKVLLLSEPETNHLSYINYNKKKNFKRGKRKKAKIKNLSQKKSIALEQCIHHFPRSPFVQ